MAETQTCFERGQIFALTPSRFSAQLSNYFMSPLSSILSCFVLYQMCFSLQETASDSDLDSAQIINAVSLKDIVPFVSHYLLSLWPFCLGSGTNELWYEGNMKEFCASHNRTDISKDLNGNLMCHIWSDGWCLMWTEKHAVCSLFLNLSSDHIHTWFRRLNSIL